MTKRFPVLLALLGLAGPALAQSTLGLDKSELKSLYAKSQRMRGWQEGTTKDNRAYIASEDTVDHLVIASYFNSPAAGNTPVVGQTVVIGRADDETMELLVNRCDKLYTRKEKGLWTSASEQMTVDILSFDGKLLMTFRPQRENRPVKSNNWEAAGLLSAGRAAARPALNAGVVTTLTGRPAAEGEKYTDAPRDGRASEARFYHPATLALDPAGYLYIGELTRVRRLALATGQVSTVAGGGPGTYTDGIGTAAAFQDIGGLALDGQGNLYVSGQFDNCIRKIVLATGAVTTLAGGGDRTNFASYGHQDGRGGKAKFSKPGALAADGKGNLYVADEGKNTIRKIVLATGEVTTVAGNAEMASGHGNGVGREARFTEPHALALDQHNNLYVGESGRIRRINLTTGQVSTVAGRDHYSSSSKPEVSPSDGLAVDVDGTIYFTTSSRTIQKLEPSTGAITTLAGTKDAEGRVDGTGTAAVFGYTGNIVLDARSTMYVADWENKCVRMVK